MASKLEYILQAVARVIQPQATNTSASGSQALNLSLTQAVDDTTNAEDLQYNPFTEIAGGPVTFPIPFATLTQALHVFIQVLGKGASSASSFVPLFNYSINGGPMSTVPVSFLILEFDALTPLTSISVENPDPLITNSIQLAYVIVGKP